MKNQSELAFDAGIRIEVADRRIFVKMPKRDADVQFVRSFRFLKSSLIIITVLTLTASTKL